MSWNLPDGCTVRDIDVAAGAYDEPEIEEPEPEPELPAELQAHWDEADEGDYRYSMDAERVQLPAAAELPQLLWNMAVAMNQAAAARYEKRVFQEVA